MDKVTYARKRLNREQWKAIIKECRSSGMTTTAWCKANGICETTYYKHLKKLREEMIESLPSSITNAETDNKPAVFRRLEVQPPVPETKAAVIIRLGIRLLKSIMVHPKIPWRQCFLRYNHHARRYHSCRKHLHRMWLYRYA